VLYDLEDVAHTYRDGDIYAVGEIGIMYGLTKNMNMLMLSVESSFCIYITSHWIRLFRRMIFSSSKYWRSNDGRIVW